MRKLNSLLIGCCLISSMNSAYAMMPVYDLSNYIQNASILANQAIQIKKQMDSLAYQFENIKQLKNIELRDLTRSIQDLNAITQQGEGISYSARNINDQFNKVFPRYASKIKYHDAYQHWNTSAMDTLKNSLQALGATTGDFHNEQQLLKRLKSQAKTSEGQMQMLQVSSELSAETVNQLQSLKFLLAAQQNAQTAYMARDVAVTRYEDDSLSEVVGRLPKSMPAYRNNANFGKITVA